MFFGKVLNFIAASCMWLGLLIFTHESVLAGGYDTGERDWDFLFQQTGFATEAAVRYINPQRIIKKRR